MHVTVFLTVLFGLTGCSIPALRSVPAAADERVAPGAAAQAGTLILTPNRPVSGQRVEAVYHPSQTLTGEPRLHLRARLRTAQHGEYNDGMGSRTVAVLERQRDGTYRGSFALPDQVVYGAFAVEDVAATRTDSREGRFWELPIHDSDGRPVFEALKQRLYDHMGRDDLAVLATAREVVRLYPENPWAWNALRFAEGWVLKDQGAAERLATYREGLRALDRALAEKRDPGADEIGYLYSYARGLGEEELIDRWRERLLAEHPGHPSSVQERITELDREYREDPAAFLRELEALWTRAQGRQARERIVQPAFWAARQVGDASTTLVWADRYTSVSPSSRTWVANILSAIESTRDEGIRRLQTELSGVEQAPDEERPLGATAAEHRQSATRRAAALRTSLGRALLAAGQTQEGIAALGQAASVDWSTSRFRSLGEARLAAGDREGATRAFAAAAADPGTSAEAGDSLRHALDLEPGPWEEAVSRARLEMRHRTLQSARSEPLPPINVAVRNGSAARLEQLIGDAPTVVVFWSRYCGLSVRAMPRIAALAERLAEEGMQLLAITRDSPAEAEPYLQEGGWNVQVLFDTEGEAARALNSWGTPQYFVLDGSGRLRFAFSSLDDLPRQIAALQAHASRSE